MELMVEGLSIALQRGEKLAYPARRISFTVKPGEFLGLVGESGSGKSLTMLALLGLESCSPGVVEGRVRYRSEQGQLYPLEGLSHYVRWHGGLPRKRTAAWQRTVYRRMKPLLGRRIAIILQDAHKTLNPFLRIEDQLLEMVARQGRADAEKAGWWGRWRQRRSIHQQLRQEALRLLKALHFRDPERVLRAYPHQLSGGMAQRVSLALALASRPEFIILDEPTTGLDVTLQAALVDLIRQLKQERRLSGIIVSHDLMFVGKVTERMAIMFSGELWEIGPTHNVIHPDFPWKHPYTSYLLSFARQKRRGSAGPAFQNVLWQRPKQGCPLRKSCPVYLHQLDMEQRRQCDSADPSPVPVFPEHYIRCWQYAWEEQKHAAGY